MAVMGMNAKRKRSQGSIVSISLEVCKLSHQAKQLSHLVGQCCDSVGRHFSASFPWAEQGALPQNCPWKQSASPKPCSVSPRKSSGDGAEMVPAPLGVRNLSASSRGPKMKL